MQGGDSKIPTPTWITMKAVSILITLKWNTHQDFVLTHPTFIRNKLQIQEPSHLAANYLIDVLSSSNKDMRAT